MPLRQPPAEQPFSATFRNWNPVRNDWVLLLLRPVFLKQQFEATDADEYSDRSATF
jgi:hypothetical protein